jgi:hypothetical protein
MSALVRLCLRIAAVEVLRADPVIYAATGGNVFDSEMGAIDSEKPLPIIIVQSEGSGGIAWSDNNGGPPFNTKTDLVFEIIHIAKGEQDGAAGLFLPATDRELEAAIDLLEWRIPEALAFAETPLALSFRKLVLKRIHEAHSERFASDDIGLRLASRMLTLRVELQEEESRVWHPDDALPTGEFASLPDPLRTIAPLFAVGSSARGTLALVAAQLAAPAYGDKFEGMDIEVYAIPPA